MSLLRTLSIPSCSLCFVLFVVHTLFLLLSSLFYFLFPSFALFMLKERLHHHRASSCSDGII